MMKNVSKYIVVLVLAVVFSIGPVGAAFAPSGLPKLKVSFALAESGSGSDGEDDDDDDIDDNDDDDDDDDDEDDGDEDDEEDDAEDEDPDDRSGDDEGDDKGEDGGEPGESLTPGSRQAGKALKPIESRATYKPGGAIVRVEVSREGIKISYADGGREEIQGGIYELRDTEGRRVERRGAQGSDIARLKAISSRVTIKSVTRRAVRPDDVRNATAQAGKIRVTYSNGWTEEVSRGVYRLINPSKRAVATRPATGVDQTRLRKLLSTN